jgi:hypothetical protein
MEVFGVDELDVARARFADLSSGAPAGRIEQVETWPGQ